MDITPPVVTPAPAAADAKPAEAEKPKDGEKEPEAAAKPNWDAAQARERKARLAIAAAKDEVKAAQARADEAEKKAAERVSALEAQAKELQPLLDALSKKDVKPLLERMGLTAVDLANMVADDGKPPTLEEIEARAVEKALAKLRAEQKEKDDAAEVARKKLEAERSAAAAKESEASFAAEVQKELKAVTAVLSDPANAEKFAEALKLDADLEALGTDKGRETLEIGKLASGAPWEVEVVGGTPTSRAAVGLSLKILASTGERIPFVEAIERVQKSVAQKRAERTGKGAGTQEPPKRDQKKSGGAGQPTLTSRSTTAPVTEPEEGDRSSLVDEESVRRTMRAIPQLRHLVAG